MFDVFGFWALVTCAVIPPLIFVAHLLASSVETRFDDEDLPTPAWVRKVDMVIQKYADFSILSIPATVFSVVTWTFYTIACICIKVGKATNDAGDVVTNLPSPVKYLSAWCEMLTPVGGTVAAILAVLVAYRVVMELYVKMAVVSNKLEKASRG